MLSDTILAEAEQIFFTKDGKIILLVDVADYLKVNYHLFQFSSTNALEDETHISSTFIDSIINNTIYANYHRIEGWAAVEEESCDVDSLGQYKITLTSCKCVGGGRHVANLIDSISIDSAHLLQIQYRTRPKGKYYFIDNIHEADSLLTERHSKVVHINSLNFEFGEQFSIRHISIDSSKNELYITHEYFIPKNNRILPSFYQALIKSTEK